MGPLAAGTPFTKRYDWPPDVPARQKVTDAHDTTVSRAPVATVMAVDQSPTASPAVVEVDPTCAGPGWFEQAASSVAAASAARPRRTRCLTKGGTKVRCRHPS